MKFKGKSVYRSTGKRLLDLALAVPALVLLAPCIALLSLLVRIKLGAPVYFLQQRPGLHGKPFVLRKFRTMTDSRDAAGRRLPDEDRMTSFGWFLRSTSLDELPELINVLRGDMSLVGPRPLLMEYLELYTPAQMRRHEVPPGITGWAQINGRAAISFEERFAMDIWYMKNQSLLLDIKIIAMTVVAVLRRRDINSEGYASCPHFTGSCRHGKDSLHN